MPTRGFLIHRAHRYKIHHAAVLFRDDHDGDELIDVIEGNRKYVRCLYAYNKVDTVPIEEIDRLARLPNSTVMSCHMNLHLDNLLADVSPAFALSVRAVR